MSTLRNHHSVLCRDLFDDLNQVRICKAFAFFKYMAGNAYVVLSQNQKNCARRFIEHHKTFSDALA